MCNMSSAHSYNEFIDGNFRSITPETAYLIFIMLRATVLKFLKNDLGEKVSKALKDIKICVNLNRWLKINMTGTRNTG